LNINISKSLDRDLRRAAKLRGKSLESLCKTCLVDGLEQVHWDLWADDLLSRVKTAQATPGLTDKQKKKLSMEGLKELAQTVAAATNGARK